MEAKCLCGSVRMSVNEDFRKVSACHCEMCATWGGGPLMAVHCGSDLNLTGQDSISVFHSSDWAERGFCKKCGSHLYYRFKPNGEYTIPAGLFENQSKFEFEEQIFIDKKPGYFEFSNPTRNMTEAEVFAKYSPGSG